MREVGRRTWKVVELAEEVCGKQHHVEKILDHVEVEEEVDAREELHGEG